MIVILECKEIDDIVFVCLESEGCLFNFLFKVFINQFGCVGFCGELVLCFVFKVVDEVCLFELLCMQVMVVVKVGEKQLFFFVGYLLSFEYFKDVVEVLGDMFSVGGKYFLFCNNIDFFKKYQVFYKGVMFYVLLIDEVMVYNELFDLFYLEKGDLKKKDIVGKFDVIVDVVFKYDVIFDIIIYDEGLVLMGLVCNLNENCLV